MSVDIAGGWAEDGRPGVPRREATAARKAAAQRIAPRIRDCEDATNLADTPRAPHERPPNVVGIGRLLRRVAGGRENEHRMFGREEKKGEAGCGEGTGRSGGGALEEAMESGEPQV